MAESNTKLAVMILAGTEGKEALGRVVNAMMVAGEFKEAGDDVRIILDGAGVQWAKELRDENHQYHDLFKQVRDRVSVCKYCANAFQVADAVEGGGLPYGDDFKDHPSMRKLVADGYQVITF